jgi:hypothetical protein
MKLSYFDFVFCDFRVWKLREREKYFSDFSEVAVGEEANTRKASELNPHLQTQMPLVFQSIKSNEEVSSSFWITKTFREIPIVCKSEPTWKVFYCVTDCIHYKTEDSKVDQSRNWKQQKLLSTLRKYVSVGWVVLQPPQLMLHEFDNILP